MRQLGKAELAPICFFLLLVAVEAGFIAYSNLENQRLAPQAVAPPVSPSLKKLSAPTLTCYRIGAYDRAQPGILANMREDNFEDLSFLGTFYRECGRWSQARKYLERSLTLAQTSGDRKRTVIALNNLGMLSCIEGTTLSGKERQETFEESEQYFQRALQELKEIDEPQLSQTVMSNHRLLQTNRSS